MMCSAGSPRGQGAAFARADGPTTGRPDNAHLRASRANPTPKTRKQARRSRGMRRQGEKYTKCGVKGWRI